MLPVSTKYIDAFHRCRIYSIHNGWALAVHGSGVKDLDIVAFPFAFDPIPITELVAGVVKASGGYLSDKHEFPIKKAHGRLCWLIILDEYHYIDFSVTPLVEKEK